MTHMLSLLPKSRFEESGVEIPGGLAFLADYRPDAIAEASAGIEGLFMPPSHPRLDADLLARLGSVRIIQTAGAGFDSVDHAAAAKLGLIVCNSPAQNAITVAEHVIGAVICLQRELAYADEAIKSGAYAQARERILGRGACELFGATVGIVGLGGIGRALAPRLAAFGATVVASDVFWPEAFAQEHGIRRVNLDELFAVSDIVTLHCPLMDATRGLVDAARLASMKPGAILVNAAASWTKRPLPPPSNAASSEARPSITLKVKSLRPAIPCSGFLRKRAAGCCSLPTSRASPARRSHA